MKQLTTLYLDSEVLKLVEKMMLFLTPEERLEIISKKQTRKSVSKSDVVEFCIKYTWETLFRKRASMQL